MYPPRGGYVYPGRPGAGMDKCTPPRGGTFIQGFILKGNPFVFRILYKCTPPGGVRLYRVFKKVLQANTFFNIHIPHSASHMLLHVSCPQPRPPAHQRCKIPSPSCHILAQLVANK